MCVCVCACMYECVCAEERRRVALQASLAQLPAVPSLCHEHHMPCSLVDPAEDGFARATCTSPSHQTLPVRLISLCLADHCLRTAVCSAEQKGTCARKLQVMDFLGSAAFSRAIQALDVKTGMLVCLKIIKVR